MATQFDQVMNILENILHRLTIIEERVVYPWKTVLGTADESGMEGELLGYANDLFGEDPYDPRDAAVEVLTPTLPGATRRFVEVRTTDGSVRRVDRNELDPLVASIVDASVQAGTFWMLYERESDGQIMVSAEERIINQVRRGTVSPTADAPDLTE